MVEIVLMGQKRSNDYVKLVKAIHSLSTSLRLFAIINSFNELLELTSKYPIDILVIDYDILKEKNNINLNSLSQVLKRIIVLVKNETNYIENPNNKYIFAKPTSLIRTLEKSIFITSTKDTKDNTIVKIAQELKYLSYNFSYIGTKYLIECIYHLYIKEQAYNDCSLKSIYTLLAKKHNKSENNIKCNIARATSIMFCECEEKKLKSYLGISSLPKTGVKLVIQTILNKLNQIY